MMILFDLRFTPRPKRPNDANNTRVSMKPDMEPSNAAARVALGVTITFWALGKFDRVGSDMGLVRAAQTVGGKRLCDIHHTQILGSCPLLRIQITLSTSTP